MTESDEEMPIDSNKSTKLRRVGAPADQVLVCVMDACHFFSCSMIGG